MLRSVVRALLRNSSSILITVPYTTSSVVGSVVSKDSVSYLTGVWGLPVEQAKSAAKYIIRGECTERADSIFKLLKSCGFRKSDVVKLISKQPGYVAADAEKDLRPKIEYLISLGISRSFLPSIICANKGILSHDLREIVPLFDFFKQFFNCNEDLASAMKRSGRMIHGSTTTIKRCVVPNILTLQARGVPYNNIAKLIMWRPASLRSNVHSFEKAVREVEEMGLKPDKVGFVLGVDSLSGLSKEHWQRKRELFAEMGWSEEDFVSAFRKQPLIMLVSESKIIAVMDFLRNSVGLTPSETARYVNLFLLSLKKRMLPRCSVLQVLMVNGRFKKQTVTICTSMVITKSKFVEKYVTEFEKDVPDVVKAYRGQLEFTGFTDESNLNVNEFRNKSEAHTYTRG